MAPTVLDELNASEDPLERDLAAALTKWQEKREREGRSRSLGYEPRDIRHKGAVEVIEARVLNGAGGFDDIDPSASYESIVVRYPTRFRPEVVELARKRLHGPADVSTRLEERDLELLGQARRKAKYKDLSADEKGAYEKVSECLQAQASGSVPNSATQKSSKFAQQRGSTPGAAYEAIHPRISGSL